jgi:predicted GH43/DUF377 family glycosyl hydrolase
MTPLQYVMRSAYLSRQIACPSRFIGATLLDRDDPSRVIGQISEPLLVPTGAERFGYVPNVVYSCGDMTHGGKLILPYAMSDLATSVAVDDLQELLASLAP